MTLVPNLDLLERLDNFALTGSGLIATNFCNRSFAVHLKKSILIDIEANPTSVLLAEGVNFSTVHITVESLRQTRKVGTDIGFAFAETDNSTSILQVAFDQLRTETAGDRTGLASLHQSLLQLRNRVGEWGLAEILRLLSLEFVRVLRDRSNVEDEAMLVNTI
jgi:hypothetical protein